MSHHLTAFALFLTAIVAGLGVSAQEAKKPASAPATGQELSKKQVDLVRKVSAYFNQITSLKGSFLQTSADNKRQRGKFFITRPGRFRFEFNPPSRVVIISDGQYIAIQDRDLSTDDRWDLGYTPFRALLQDNVDLLRDARVLEAEEKE